ncbi:MAG: SNF2-related protein [Chloroflexota bacterium]
MFRLRLTAGRATAPLGRPPIAAARGVQIPVPEILLLGQSPEMALRADAPARVLYQAPSPPATFRPDFEPLAPLPVQRMDAWLEAADEGLTIPIPQPAAAVLGGAITLLLPRRLGSAPELPSNARTGGTDASWAHPYLEPGPSLDEANVFLGFPRILRPYQMEAVHQLLTHDGFLLADDPGTGKTVAVCVTLQALFQGRQVRRALVICLDGGSRHWATHLAAWTPGLAVTAVHGNPDERRGDWTSAADIFLVDYDGLAADLDAGRLTPEQAVFDLIVLDDVHALQRRAGQPHPVLDRLAAKRRWALAGALPREAGEWLTLFAFLTPDRGVRASEITLPNLTRRFLPDTLRRTKADIADELPRLTRDELWVDLDPRQRQLYQVILAEEQQRLAALGAVATRSHLQAALNRLQQACNFAPGSLDGCKVRPLVNIVEDIVSAGAKVVVFSQFRGEGLERLRQVLEAYGTVVADSEAREEARAQALASFRAEPNLHVLLADDQLRPSDGPLAEASYVIHFDHGWNPAVRRRVETRLHPDPGPPVPVNVIEFWVAGTIDERLHQLLAERSLLPADLPQDVRAALLEDHLTPADLLQGVLDVPSAPTPGPTPIVVMPGRRTPPAPQAERQALLSLAPERLLAGVGQLMLALGFEGSEVIRGPQESGGDLVASRGSGPEAERVLVRCVRGAKDVGVGEGRELLAALNARPDLRAAYLVSTAHFTPACIRLALESGGRLTLVSGAEFYRHLHILGTT